VTRWEAWTSHLGWTLTAGSGVLYGVLKYFVRSSDPDSRMGHPWQPGLLAIHVVAAPLAIFGFGLLFRRHVLARLTADGGAKRLTGTAMTLLAVPVAMSGYVLQTLTGDAARRWTGWIHAGLGLIFALGYAAHAFRSGLPDDAAKPAPEAQDDLS